MITQGPDGAGDPRSELPGMSPAQRRELIGLVGFIGSLTGIVLTVGVVYGLPPAVLVTLSLLAALSVALMLDL